jgi:hypothetical protein
MLTPRHTVKVSAHIEDGVADLFGTQATASEDRVQIMGFGGVDRSGGILGMSEASDRWHST